MSVAATTREAVPIRAEITEVFDRVRERIGSAGTWWTGAERVAIAQATRDARSCPLCAQRKDALSPYAVDGAHSGGRVLPAALVDAVHRITTDPARLSRRVLDDVLAAGLSAEQYVEALGVVVRTINLDVFHHVAGLEPWAMPAPRPGSPSRASASAAVDGGAWLPMLPVGHEFWRGWQPPNVMRALSLVPEEVVDIMALARAEYLGPDHVADASYDPGRAISRAQMELIAGRVSSLSECFY